MKKVPNNKLQNKIKIRKSKSTWEQLCQCQLGTIVPVSLGNNCATLTWEQLCQSQLGHSHKKRKNSLEGSLDQVLFAVELEFPNILVPRLPQNSSNVNIECAGKSRQLYSLCDQLL